MYLWRECVRVADGERGWCGDGKERRPAVLIMGGHSGCQIQVFWGGDRGGNGGGVVTGSTGYWWLCSGHWQWVPCMSEGGRERRGKAGGADERLVGTETEELATISSEKTRDQTRKREEDGVSCYEKRV